MRFDLFSRLAVIATALALAIPAPAQQTSGTFRWVDFHAPQDQNIVVWVTRSLAVEKWTAIREIGLEYDAALVETADRKGSQASPSSDSFTIWNVSLTNHLITPLIKGVNLRWFDVQNFATGAPAEPTILYDNCHDCAASTYFTSFHYDYVGHTWAARWIRGSQGIPVWNMNPDSAAGVTWTQVYALMPGAQDRDYLCTWNHFDYGKGRQSNDMIFRYDVDPMTGLDRTVELTGAEAEAMKVTLCRGQDAIQGLERGQNSDLCQQILKLHPARRPVTTPPANNRGQSSAGHRRY